MFSLTLARQVGPGSAGRLAGSRLVVVLARQVGPGSAGRLAGSRLVVVLARQVGPGSAGRLAGSRLVVALARQVGSLARRSPSPLHHNQLVSLPKLPRSYSMLRLSSTKLSETSASAARTRLQRAIAADRLACADQRGLVNASASTSEELLLKLLATECPLPAGRA